MEYLDYLYENEPRNIRRMILDRSDPLTAFNDFEFRDRFRLHKHSAVELCSVLEDDLGIDGNRGSPLSAMAQLLVALRFYADGTFHRETGDLMQVSKATVCRIVHKVARSLCGVRNRYVLFPNEQQRHKYKQDFYQIGDFPGVIGCIDGSHVPIIKPHSIDYEEYRCRKGFYSINVQGICAPDLQFSNVVARWKGSTHDSRVWSNSALYARFESGEFNGYLLGDQGYPCSQYILTPFFTPQNDHERAYNRSQRPTRNMAEHMFGVWKSRFTCLRNPLRFSPRRCCNVIVATAVLHNFCKQNNEPDVPMENDVAPGNDVEVNVNADDRGRGNATRQHVVNNYF